MHLNLLVHDGSKRPTRHTCKETTIFARSKFMQQTENQSRALGRRTKGAMGCGASSPELQAQQEVRAFFSSSWEDSKKRR